MGATVLLAAALRLVYGRGSLGYDASWALLWGQQIADGGLPRLDAPGAPTPHPLSIVLSALVAPLGRAGIELVVASSWLALGALGWLAFRLGEALYSAWIGALFALLLLTRPLLGLEAGQSVIDVPFLALVVAAMLAEARRPRSGWTVPALLALAGLLRPEGWLLGFAWAAWAATARQDRVALAAAALAAPVAWMLVDLAATGDPLHSLHGTQELAEQLARPRDLDTALQTTPSYLRFALTAPVLWLGLAGFAAALVLRYERTLLPAAVAALGLFAFLVLGATGLPLLSRYLLLPAALLALWCAFAALGFTLPDAHSRAWLVAGVVSFAVLAAGVPELTRDWRAVHSLVDSRRDAEQDLAAILDAPAVRAALARCRTVSLPDGRPRALAAYLTGAAVAVVGRGDEARGVTITYATEGLRQRNRIGPASPPGVPPGSDALAANRSWIASVAGSSPCG